VNSLGNLGGFAGPYIVGLLQDATGGTSGAFLGLAGLALSAVAICFVLGRMAARPVTRAPAAPIPRPASG
jgi:nitrate/nitrite transporter NarK